MPATANAAMPISAIPRNTPAPCEEQRVPSAHEALALSCLDSWCRAHRSAGAVQPTLFAEKASHPSASPASYCFCSPHESDTEALQGQGGSSPRFSASQPGSSCRPCCGSKMLNLWHQNNLHGNRFGGQTHRSLPSLQNPTKEGCWVGGRGAPITATRAKGTG
ncbi:unnamed protein product [Lepidochelys kempii]